MTSNDRVILDKVFEQQRSEIAPALSASAYFEIFTAEQVLKDYDLSYPEIESGIVGNGGDGGIDSIYTFVNGELLREDSDLSFLKKNIDIELYLIQSKASATFSEEVLHKLTAVTNDLLNLSHLLEDYSTVYNEDLLRQIKLFRDNFVLFASRFPSLQLNYIYASHGESIHPNVDRKVKILENATKSLFTSSKFQFQFLGSKELLALARRSPKTTYSLTLAENPICSECEVGFICLVSLRDYYQFITDE